MKASNSDAEDQFGTALGFDRDTLVVGAPFEASASPGIDGDESNNSANSAGAVYIIR